MLRRMLVPTVLRGTAVVTYSISGTVYDADGSTPVPGATVALGAYTAESGVDGTFTIADIPAGTSGSMTCTLSGHNWADIAIAAMSGHLTGQDYTANNYAAILSKVYSASEVYPLVDILSGTDIPAYISAAHDGTLAGWDLQNAAGPVTGTLAPYSDGVDGTDRGNIGSIALIWNGAIGSAFIFGKVSDVADWTDGVERFLFYHWADSNNQIYIYKQDTTTGIRAFIKIGGVARIVTIGSPAAIGEGWFCVGVTWKDGANGNEVRCYLNGSQVGATLSGVFGVWAGTPSSDFIGTSAINNVWKGWMSYHALKFGSVWSAADMANIYAARTTAGVENP